MSRESLRQREICPLLCCELNPSNLTELQDAGHPMKTTVHCERRSSQLAFDLLVEATLPGLDEPRGLLGPADGDVISL